MLINLCGAPCSGKSTLAKRFVAEFPEFQFISIDDLRLETNDELEAWYLMNKRAVGAEHCIVESSGLSIKLEGYILSDLQLQARGIFTIIIAIDTDVLLDRLKQRQDNQEKEEIPFIYDNLSEEGLIKRFDSLIATRYPVAWYLEGQKTIDESYKALKHIIQYKKREIERAIS